MFKENNLIYDPFIGSGSTALAALKSGRRYIGVDLKQEYVELANERIEAYQIEKKYGKIMKKRKKKSSKSNAS